jgi:octaprenyl-diphosphate synthase
VLLMAARMAGYTGERAILYASVIEFIHTATLVHDDIIDEAELRRGREAVHTRWGNHLTVLFGDFLYLKSMSLALTQDSLEIIRLLCDVTLRIVEGEIYQLTKNGDVELTEEEHLDIVRRKTAFLFAGCAKIGAMLGSTTREQQEAMWEYGLNIGMAFQIVDDLLDFTARQEELGKPVLSDLKEGKLTLPLILLLPRLDAARRRRLEQVLEDRDFRRVAPAEVLEMVAAAGTLDEAADIARRHADLAQQQLTAFPPSDARDALEYAPEFVLNRRA